MYASIHLGGSPEESRSLEFEVGGHAPLDVQESSGLETHYAFFFFFFQNIHKFTENLHFFLCHLKVATEISLPPETSMYIS